MTPRWNSLPGNLRGAVLMSLAAMLFAGEALAIRYMNERGIPTAMQLFARSFGQLLWVMPLLLQGGVAMAWFGLAAVTCLLWLVMRPFWPRPSAAETAPDAIDALVYICAMMLPDGLSRAEFKAMEEAKGAGKFTYGKLVTDTDVAKISVVGIGMRSQVGVAAKMFAALAAENVNIKVISTSEIKISVLIDRKYMELAVQALHDVFELDKA